MSETPRHVPVMPAEVVHWLAAGKGAVLVDGTVGGGGHARLLAEAAGSEGRVLALDRDPLAIHAAETSLAGLPVELVHANYADLPEVLRQLGIDNVQGIVLDLGMSSDQLADQERGFSFDSDGPLDLRFDPSAGEPGWKLIERLSQDALGKLIHEYGEERHSRRVAREIVRRRMTQPIKTARDLARLVRSVVGRSRGRSTIDPATRTFQAMRIAVNEELKWLEVGLRRLPDCLAPHARLAVISFHSLEDRRVKQAFRDDARLKALTKKPVRATEAEIEENPRARSAKLRIAERVETG